jgi:hypothetical protein
LALRTTEEQLLLGEFQLMGTTMRATIHRAWDGDTSPCTALIRLAGQGIHGDDRLRVESANGVELEAVDSPEQAAVW